jgi:hypothetical protein
MARHEQHLRARHVGEHRHVVVAQHPRRHPAVGVEPDLLEQRGPERLRDPALHLAPQLDRIDDGPRVHGLHRLQDPDLAAAHVHRHPEPLRAERHRPRGSIAEPLGLQQLGVVRRPPQLGQCQRRPQRRRPRDHRPRRAVGPGVVPARVGVRRDDLHPLRRAAQRRGGQLLVHRRRPVPELSGPDEQPEAAPGHLRYPRVRHVTARRDGVKHGNGQAGPGAPADAGRGGLPVPARQRPLH